MDIKYKYFLSGYLANANEHDADTLHYIDQILYELQGEINREEDNPHNTGIKLKKKQYLIDLINDMDILQINFLIQHLKDENIIIEDKDGSLVWTRVVDDKQRKTLKDSKIL